MTPIRIFIDCSPDSILLVLFYLHAFIDRLT